MTSTMWFSDVYLSRNFTYPVDAKQLLVKIIYQIAYKTIGVRVSDRLQDNRGAGKKTIYWSIQQMKAELPNTLCIKKGSCRTLAITSPNLSRFSKSFH
jgi:hypothetical protein